MKKEMSFSSNVKEELSRVPCRRTHCQIAEFAALFAFCGQLRVTSSNGMHMAIQSENLPVIRKCFTLLRKSFNISGGVAIRTIGARTKLYTVCVLNTDDVLRVMQALKILGPDRRISVHGELVNPLIIQSDCCKRAFIRGAFLSAGSMSDPHKSYHLEIVCPSLLKAAQLQSIMKNFALSAKTVQRKNNYVVYLKDGDQIVDILNIMEAHKALLELENIRILHDIANQVNRQTNCEVANSQKTITASARQQEDILLIQRTIGFGQLSDGLAQLASLRLEYPDLPLKELGERLSPPIGKSGVNHRLRKLNQIANKIRETKQGELL